MREETEQVSTHHKEETKSGIIAASQDRKKLREKLQHCIDPLDPVSHPPILFNIISGKVADTSVNEQNAMHIDKNALQSFEEKLPQGFHSPISSLVVTMANKWTKTVVGSKATFDREVNFSLSLGITGTTDFDFPTLFPLRTVFPLRTSTRTSIFVSGRWKHETSYSQIKVEELSSCRKHLMKLGASKYFSVRWMCCAMVYTLANRWDCACFGNGDSRIPSELCCLTALCTLSLRETSNIAPRAVQEDVEHQQ